MQEAAPVGPILVTPARLHEVPRTIKVLGSLMGDEEAVVGAEVAGRVSVVGVDIGTRVRRGDHLAALDLEDFEVKIKQARAELAAVRARLGLKGDQTADNLDRARAPAVAQKKALLEGAEANFKRAETLLRTNAIAYEDFQLRETALKVASADYRAALHQVDEQIALLETYASALVLAENALADATITAPFDGIVSGRHVAPGVYLHVGEPVVTLVRTDPLRFQAGVPEHDALRVHTGQTALVSVAGQDAPLEGKVSRVSPTLNLASRSLPIEIDVPNPDLRLRAGLFAEAEIVVDPRARALVVPQSAIVDFAGVEKVCVVEGVRAVLRRVVTGRKLGDGVEVVDGLSPGEQVAVKGNVARAGPVGPVEVLAGASTPSDPPAAGAPGDPPPTAGAGLQE